ncbi:MAG: hypothetical protein K6E16_07945 [Lachnospiraceae bacterium]|nr:hypothetical protein [Lachnospiraceae bacterium]
MNNVRKVCFSILLIVLAVCLVLWKLNVFSLPVAVAGVSTWGLIVSAIMILIIIHSILDLHFGGIFIPLAVICIVFAVPLGITAITPWTVLIAAFLLTAAFDMLFSKHRIHRRYDHVHGRHAANNFSSESYDDESGHVIHTTRFGTSTKYVRNEILQTADLSTQFGEMSVFFDGAKVPDGTVIINCQTSFGEMDIYIPKEWRVQNKVSVALGDCQDRCSGNNPADAEVTCVIAGSVSFGELKLMRV